MKNIANYISISRIIMSIALIITKTFSIPFYILYMFCGISDMLDGYLARKYKATSEKGAQIDSIADIVFILVSMIKILPVLNFSKLVYMWTITIAIIKIYNFIWGYVYYKRLVMPHTIANKITGFMLFAVPLIIRYVDVVILETIICTVATFVAIQEGYYIRTRKI